MNVRTFSRAVSVLVCCLGATVTLVGEAASQGSPPRPLVSEAQFEAWQTQLSNWGRWGKDDQLGTLNLITSAKRRAAFLSSRTRCQADDPHRPSCLASTGVQHLRRFLHGSELLELRPLPRFPLPEAALKDPYAAFSTLYTALRLHRSAFAISVAPRPSLRICNSFA